MSVEDAEIYTRLTPIFRDIFDDDELEARAEMTAKDVPGWDSLRNIRLMLTVERSFGVRLSALEIGKLQNVGELIGLLRVKLAGKS